MNRNPYNNIDFKLAKGYLMTVNNCICKLCGYKSKSNHIHHIDKNAHNNKLENLIIVCSDCHKLLH